MTAAEIADALHRRYGGTSQGHDDEKYIRIEEARAGAGLDGGGGRCDFLAICTWPSQGLELIGHEIKVSRADWRKELESQHKAETFARFCRRWYVVTPSALAAQIKHEVPETWGLLSVSDAGRVTEVIAAPVRKDVKDVPKTWWVGWMTGIDRTHKRAFPPKLAAAMKDERDKFDANLEHEVAKRHHAQASRLEALENNVRSVKEATGIDLAHSQTRFHMEALKRVWAVTKDTHLNLDYLIRQLNSAATDLAALMTVMNGDDRPSAQ